MHGLSVHIVSGIYPLHNGSFVLAFLQLRSNPKWLMQLTVICRWSIVYMEMTVYKQHPLLVTTTTMADMCTNN